MRQLTRDKTLFTSDGESKWGTTSLISQPGGWEMLYRIWGWEELGTFFIAFKTRPVICIYLVCIVFHSLIHLSACYFIHF